MKPLVAQILIGTSILTGAALGYRMVRLFYLLSQTVPEETVFFGWSPWSLIGWLLIALFPIVLYGCAVALHRRSISSELGRAGLVTGILYLIVVIAGCAYSYRFVSTSDRNTIHALRQRTAPVVTTPASSLSVTTQPPCQFCASLSLRSLRVATLIP